MLCCHGRAAVLLRCSCCAAVLLRCCVAMLLCCRSVAVMLCSSAAEFCCAAAAHAHVPQLHVSSCLSCQPSGEGACTADSLSIRTLAGASLADPPAPLCIYVHRTALPQRSNVEVYECTQCARAQGAATLKTTCSTNFVASTPLATRAALRRA